MEEASTEMDEPITEKAIKLDQETILQQLDDQDHRAMNFTIVTFCRAHFLKTERRPCLPWWLVLVVLAIIAFTVIAATAGFLATRKTPSEGAGRGPAGTPEAIIPEEFKCSGNLTGSAVYRINVAAFGASAVTQKLDYISDLGADYISINPLEDNLPEKFTKELVREGKKKDIKILYEISLVYAPIDLQKFKESDYIIWKYDDEYKENLYRPGYESCTLKGERKYFGVGINAVTKTCPVAILNLKSKNIQEYLKNLVDTWIEDGVSGFMILDLALANFGEGGDDPMKLLGLVRSWVGKETIIIADTGSYDETKRDAQRFYEKGANMFLGGVMRPLKVAAWEMDVKASIAAIQKAEDELPKNETWNEAYQVVFALTGHPPDIYGLLKRYSEGTKYSALFLITYTLPGVPFIYAGEEWARTGNTSEKIYWDEEHLNETLNSVQVKGVSKAGEDTWNFVKELAALRKSGKIGTAGKWKKDGSMGYLRFQVRSQAEGNTMLLLVNLGDEAKQYDECSDFKGGKAEILIATPGFNEIQDCKGSLRVESGVLLEGPVES